MLSVSTPRRVSILGSSPGSSREKAGDQYEHDHANEDPCPNVREVERPAEAAPVRNE